MEVQECFSNQLKFDNSSKERNQQFLHSWNTSAQLLNLKITLISTFFVYKQKYISSTCRKSLYSCMKYPEYKNIYKSPNTFVSKVKLIHLYPRFINLIHTIKIYQSITFISNFLNPYLTIYILSRSTKGYSLFLNAKSIFYDTSYSQIILWAHKYDLQS